DPARPEGPFVARLRKPSFERGPIGFRQRPLVALVKSQHPSDSALPDPPVKVRTPHTSEQCDHCRSHAELLFMMSPRRPSLTPATCAASAPTRAAEFDKRACADGYSAPWLFRRALIPRRAIGPRDAAPPGARRQSPDEAAVTPLGTLNRRTRVQD